TRAFQAQIARSLAALPPPPPRPGSAAAPPRPPPYRLPLEGTLVTGFGEISDAGIHARGSTLRPAADTLVLAPRHGRIAFAGRFRSYGEVVILDHGGGWTTTITNLAALSVAKGATVAAGEPLGRAEAGAEVSVELRLHARPMPIAPFL
ncbi:MAG TPA: peptidoglycan DD-metalloendopeptidase family protein, partial [Allosphingosinicella sp.]